MFISPPGLSVTTKLAPDALPHPDGRAVLPVGRRSARAIAGWLAQFYDPTNEVPYFTILGFIAIVLGVALLFSVKPVLALMKGVR